MRSFFVRKVILLTGASALSPLLVFLFSPFITRVYSPEEYGLFGVFEAIVAIFLAFSLLGYNSAIPVPETEGEATELLLISMVIALVWALVVGLGVVYFGHEFALLVNAPGLEPYLWMLPLAVLFTASFQCSSSWAVRQSDFRSIAQSRLAQGMTQGFAQLGLGTLGFNILGLVLGLTLGRFIAGIAMLIRFLPTWLVTARFITLNSLHATAWYFRRLPILGSWSELLNAVSVQIAVLLVSYFFGAQVVGWFSLAVLMVAGPLLIIQNSILQVFLAEAGALDRDQKLGEASLNLYGSLVTLSTAPTLLFMVCAPELFSVLFGNEWRVAGEYAAWIALTFVFSLHGAHLRAVVILRHQQFAELMFNIALLGVRILALLVGALIDKPVVAVAAYSVVSAVVLAGYNAWLLKITGGDRLISFFFLGREFIIAGLLVSPVLLSKHFLELPLTLVVVGLTSACIMVYLNWAKGASR